MELQNLAKDSLLNSLKVKEEAPIENRDVEVPCPHVINNNEADTMGKDKTYVPRPSLLERNLTILFLLPDSTLF